jgi:hypothetical protein
MSKLNRLIGQWPRGAILTASRLRELGFTPDLLRKYKSSRWLEAAGHGAYKLANDPVDYLGAVYALQSQLGMTVHPGGKTALELQGLGHYASTGRSMVFLYGRRGERLPGWFKSYAWPQSIQYQATTLLPDPKAQYLSDRPHMGFNVKVSCRELAALEMLYHVPDKQGFDEAVLIMQGLVALRPDVVQSLLEQCGSVKVKRLFLYTAERAGHQWVKKLDMSRINLGAGKRMIVKGGMLDSKYGITVPREQSQ